MSYDPFIRGRYSVGVRTLEARDAARSLTFTCELWYPASESHFGQDFAPEKFDVYALPGGRELRTQPAVRDAAAADGRHPFVVYSHGATRWQRRSATFLCTHLASHGYVVAALDHYETLVPGGTRDDLTKNRAADITFLLNFMLGPSAPSDVQIEPSRIAAVGYSLGGWTVLRAMEDEERIRAVAALAPAGSSQARPGIFNAKLTFKWKREAPVLLLSAANDTITPLKGMSEIFKRMKPPKRAFTLKRADHAHFLDEVEEEHEYLRTTKWPEEMQWISAEMHPAGDLSPNKMAHDFTNGLVLAHLDTNLMWTHEGRTWSAGDMKNEFAARGIDAVESGRVLP